MLADVEDIPGRPWACLVLNTTSSFSSEPLGALVDAKLKAKIWSHQYTDLALFLSTAVVRIWMYSEIKLNGCILLAGKKSNHPLSPDFVPSAFAHLHSPEKRRGSGGGHMEEAAAEASEAERGAKVCCRVCPICVSCWARYV